MKFAVYFNVLRYFEHNEIDIFHWSALQDVNILSATGTDAEAEKFTLFWVIFKKV